MESRLTLGGKASSIVVLVTLDVSPHQAPPHTQQSKHATNFAWTLKWGNWYITLIGCRRTLLDIRGLPWNLPNMLVGKFWMRKKNGSVDWTAANFFSAACAFYQRCKSD